MRQNPRKKQFGWTREDMKMQKNKRMMRRLAMLVLLLCSLAPCALARSYSLGDEAA